MDCKTQRSLSMLLWSGHKIKRIPLQPYGTFSKFGCVRRGAGYMLADGYSTADGDDDNDYQIDQVPS